MKILIVGLGSIGQRHLKNVIQLGYTDVQIVTRTRIVPEPFAHLVSYTTVEQALASQSFDAAIICTPTAIHLEALFPLLRSRIQKIYVEKPVSHTLDQLDAVVQLAGSHNSKICIGFDLHFDEGLQTVKEWIDADKIGNVVSVNAQVGQYLPDWRPYQDHRVGMSAKMETGGGVLLDLIHEFDYLYWLCGPAEHVAALQRNTGALQIETEEVADVLLQFSSGVIGTIHLDYLQPKLIRNCLFTGDQGSITWNLAAQQVQWISTQKQTEVYTYDQQRNDRFTLIMKQFLENTSDTRLSTLDQGIEVLKMVEAAKLSAAKKQFIFLADLLLTPKNAAQ